MALQASFTLVAALYIAAADSQGPGHLSLALGRAAVQAIAQGDHLPLPVCQTGFHRPAQLDGLFPPCHLFQQIAVCADHIHQRQRRPFRPRLNAVGQGHILGTFAPGAKIHQDLICYHLPNDF